MYKSYNEKDLLYISYGMTDDLYRQAEISLELMKSALDIDKVYVEPFPTK